MNVTASFFTKTKPGGECFAFKNSYTKCYGNPTNSLVAAIGSHSNVISIYDFLLRSNLRRRSSYIQDSECWKKRTLQCDVQVRRDVTRQVQFVAL